MPTELYCIAVLSLRGGKTQLSTLILVLLSKHTLKLSRRLMFSAVS